MNNVFGGGYGSPWGISWGEISRGLLTNTVLTVADASHAHTVDNIFYWVGLGVFSGVYRPDRNSTGQLEPQELPEEDVYQPNSKKSGQLVAVTLPAPETYKPQNPTSGNY